MCLKVDMCYNFNRSSTTGHWTQTSKLERKRSLNEHLLVYLSPLSMLVFFFFKLFFYYAIRTRGNKLTHAIIKRVVSSADTDVWVEEPSNDLDDVF